MVKSDVKSIAIGSFDGLHLGHTKLFDELDENGAIVVISKNSANLTPGNSRQKYVRFPCFYYKFEDIRNLGGEEFIQVLKTDFVNLEKIVVGYDFKFGKNRSCGSSDLKKMFGNVVVVEEFRVGDIAVHSSIIREFIRSGNLKDVSRLLGRKYCIEGDVVKGQGIGEKQIVATINFQTNRYLIPKDGVYATFSTVNSNKYKSITFIGRRFSTDAKFSMETHIIEKFNQTDFKTVEVCFVEFIRGNEKFENLNNLKDRILKDIKTAERILKNER